MTCTPTAHSSLVYTVLFALIPGALQRHTRHPKTKDTAKTLHRHPPAKTRAPTDCTHCKDTHCERCCHCTRVAPTHLEGKRTELKKWGKWTILKVLYSYCIQHLNLCVSDCKVFITCPVGQSIGGSRGALSIFGWILVSRYLTLTCHRYLRIFADHPLSTVIFLTFSFCFEEDLHI